MLVFRDRFNRANGGIGASYTDAGAATSITSNQITFTSSLHTIQCNTTVSDSGAYIQLKAVAIGASPNFCRLYMTDGSQNGYSFGWDSTAGSVRRIDSGSLSGNLGATFTSPAAGDIVTVVYDNATDTVSVYYNNSLQGTRTDSTYNPTTWTMFIGAQGTDVTIDDLEYGSISLGTYTQSIGTSGRNYSTIQAWADECPPYLTLSNTVYKGECYNDSEFTASGNAVCAVPTVASDSTRYLWLTAAAGQSFQDNAGAASLPLVYDQSKGVGLRCTGNYARLLVSPNAAMRCDRLQFYYDSTYASNYYVPIQYGVPGSSLTSFVYQSRRTSSSEFFLDNGSFFIANGTVALRGSGYGGNVIAFRGASIVVSSVTIFYDTALGSNLFSRAFAPGFGNYGTVRDCAVFGMERPFEGTLASWTASNNASDDNGTYMAGTANQTSLSASSVFENASDATLDLRPKAGGALISNGVRDQAYTSDLDVIGAARSTTAPTIGAREFISTGPRPLFSSGGKWITSGGKILRL